MKYHTASVCIPSCYVQRARKTFPRLNICTVIGFPLGYQTALSKAAEADCALSCGANEIDTVINIALLKDGNEKAVRDELMQLRTICQNAVLKVIIETCYLTEQEKIRMCEIVSEVGANYIKTSTGFSKAGATFDDIRLFKENIGPEVKMKAAGGISSIEDAEEFLRLGADRLGTSRIVKIVKQMKL
jgi:deoxyribose-phosphate aldolase